MHIKVSLIGINYDYEKFNAISIKYLVERRTFTYYRIDVLLVDTFILPC